MTILWEFDEKDQVPRTEIRGWLRNMVPQHALSFGLIYLATCQSLPFITSES